MRIIWLISPGEWCNHIKKLAEESHIKFLKHSCNQISIQDIVQITFFSSVIHLVTECDCRPQQPAAIHKVPLLTLQMEANVNQYFLTLSLNVFFCFSFKRYKCSQCHDSNWPEIMTHLLVKTSLSFSWLPVDSLSACSHTFITLCSWTNLNGAAHWNRHKKLGYEAVCHVGGGCHCVNYWSLIRGWERPQLY